MLNRSRLLALGIAVLAVIVVGCKSEFLAGGKLHFDQQRYEQALQNFDKAAAEQPNSSEAHMWRARALGRLDRDQEAEAALTRAAELDKTGELREDIDNTRISFWSQRYTSGQADAGEAEKERGKLTDYRGAGQTELAASAEEAMRVKLEAAVDRFQRAVLYCPDSVQNYSNLGKLYFQLGREDEGEQMFMKARSMAGDRPELLQYLFLVFRSLGVQGMNDQSKEGYQRAVEMFSEAATFDRPPEDMATLYFNIGVAHTEIADRSEGAEKTAELESARDAYVKVLEINPVDQDALKNLSLVYGELGDHANAIAVGMRLLNTEPWNPEFHEFMTRIYYASGDRQKGTAHAMLRSSIASGAPLSPSTVRDETRRCPGKDMQKALLDRGEPEQLYRYTSGSGDQFYIWIYWTEGRVFIYEDCIEVFRSTFEPVAPERLRELIGG